MWPYWLLFLLPAIQALNSGEHLKKNFNDEHWSLIWKIILVLLAVMIGFRHQVGGDWFTYLENMEANLDLTFFEALNGAHGDPSDNLLNWIAAKSELGIYLVNLIYGTIFSFGLLTFCRNQPRSWLALTVAVPYLITVVAMGYSRQGVAIGLVMFGLVALENKKLLKFIVLIAFASTFHKSAVILMPLALLTDLKSRLMTLIGIIVTTIILFILLLQEYIDSIVKNYIFSEYESSGAMIRISMNALPACLFLLMRSRFNLSSNQKSFWSWMSCGGLLFVLLLYLSPSSTAVDRVALYWIPLQLFVWSRIPDAIGYPGRLNSIWVYAVISYSAVIHFTWLYFAQTSFAWLPYQFYPWVWLWK